MTNDPDVTSDEISEATSALKSIESAWLYNPHISARPAVEGAKLGGILVRWSCEMYNSKVFATNDYFQKLFRFNSHLKQQVPNDSNNRAIWGDFATAVLNEFDKQGARDAALVRGELRVVYPSGDRHMSG
jgi:hypothetical protein